MTRALAVPARSTRTVTGRISDMKFIKRKSIMAKSEPQVNINSVSRISSGTSIIGEMRSSSDIRVDGCFEGKLYTDGKVVVGETAEVKGDIVCSNIDIWGKVGGNLIIKDTTSLKAGCSVDGNLKVRKLIVELDSVFNGTCRMITVEEYESMAREYRPEQNNVREKGQQTSNDRPRQQDRK